MASTAMAVLDTTIVNVALPAMMRELHATLPEVEWVATAYLIAMCVMLPTTGWLAQRWGYKRIYISGLLLFTAGSMACALSDSLFLLLVSRSTQGLGSGMLQALGMALVTRAFTPEKRGVAIGWWALAAAASVSLGPFVGGWLMAHYSWHVLFVPNVPIGVAVAVVAMIVMTEERQEQMGRFDPCGFLMLGLSAPLLVVGLSLGASASGAANTAKQISGSFGIALFTALFAASSRVEVSFLLAALFSVVGLVVVLFLPRK